MKLVVAVLVSTLMCGGAIAQTPASSASANASGPALASADAKRDAAVEKHIKELHASLKITAAEEAQWSTVAATMRDNATDLDKAIDKRAANMANATAIDDLNAYAVIAQTHANGVKKLADAFSGLYTAMSDDQKKEADLVFSHRGHAAGKMAKQ